MEKGKKTSIFFQITIRLTAGMRLSGCKLSFVGRKQCFIQSNTDRSLGKSVSNEEHRRKQSITSTVTFGTNIPIGHIY